MSEFAPVDSLPWKQIVAKSVHDMKTPLSCLRTTVEILRMTSGGDPRQVRLIGVLDAQIDELNGHLEKLLNSPEEIVQNASAFGGRGGL
ncbi:MAG: histidine kinase dimerization/phospho-acceptor domain-containing protein [Verrucomicrobiota bacterium]